MINIKGGTKTWAEPGRTPPMRGDNTQIVSADKRDNVIGDQDLGAYLNKIADPNYVDPTKTRKVGNPDLDKDAFLKLFLAQLKNQDPTSPLESHELAAQLAQFSSIEKLDTINNSIGGLAKAQAPSHNYDSLALIGKYIEGDSARIIRSDVTDSHDIRFNLAGDATKATLSIRDMQGNELRKLEISGLKKGDNKVSWDGNLENGSGAPVGDYQVVIDAKNSSGQNIFAQTAFKGQITGVKFTAEGPVLMMGKTMVRMSDVKQISDPQLLQKADQDVNAVTQVKDLKAAQGDIPLNVAGMGGNLENIGMSSGLINKIEKEFIKGDNKQENQTELNGKEVNL
jgi:flagellar basal-body rod modification protein FlgD